MALDDFDFSVGSYLSPVDSQQFGVAPTDSSREFSFSPDAQKQAYTSGFGIDTTKYNLNKTKPNNIDWLKVLGMGMGVAGDIIGATKGIKPSYSSALLSRMSGDGLTDYLNSDPSKTSGLASIFAKLFNKNFGEYIEAATTRSPMA
jgi:hypothetical protein